MSHQNEVNSSVAAATILRLSALVALLATAACGGQSADTDPLASIAESVREEERTPAPLAEVWRRQPEEPLTLRPAVGLNNVYLAQGNQLEAWSVTDGSARWAPIVLDSEISAPPVALGQQVVVASRGTGTISPRVLWFANDSTLVSQTPVDTPISEISAVPGTITFIDENGVGRLGGGIDWHTPVDGAVTVELADTHGLTLVTTASGKLLAFDVGSGALRWEYDAGGEITRARIGTDRVYVGAGALGVRALNIANGRVAWQRRLGTAVMGAPGLSGEILWVAGLDATLHAFKASNGTEMSGAVWRLDLSSRNYLDITTFDLWVIVGATYGPWLAVRSPTRHELIQRPTRVVVRQPNTQGRPDLTLAAGSGAAGVAVVNGDGTVVFLQPQRAR